MARFLATPMKPRICLNMIVRNEAHVIERCLASVKPHIDHWVIVDTGSTDDTPARIAGALAGVPGMLHHRPWLNFGHNRSEALALAKAHGEYLLFIDADEQLVCDNGATWPVLQGAAYSLEARYAELSYDRCLLVQSRLPWRWVGVLHEYLDCGTIAPQPRVPGFWVKVTADGARSGDAQKFAKDAAVLEAALLAEPDNVRYRFYLAQSCKDAGLLAEALKHYQLRAAAGGWEEEVWYSLYECARLSERLGLSHEAIVSAYLKAYQYRPSRAESLTTLATYCRNRLEWHNAYLFATTAALTPLPADRLFVDMTVYGWRAKDELALAAFYSGRAAQALVLWKELRISPSLPASEQERMTRNLGYAVGLLT
jgi:glycosyltransferase involved in cell wall biosynthesis